MFPYPAVGRWEGGRISQQMQMWEIVTEEEIGGEKKKKEGPMMIVTDGRI